MNPTGRLRRSSAGSRRHHAAYLPFKIRAAVPGASTVVVTPLPAADSIRDVTVYGQDGQLLHPQPGEVAHVLSLLQTAHPGAAWGRTLVWQADGNTFGPVEQMAGAA